MSTPAKSTLAFRAVSASTMLSPIYKVSFGVLLKCSKANLTPSGEGFAGVLNGMTTADELRAYPHRIIVKNLSDLL